MKFSEALTEYLQLREDEHDADHGSEPLARSVNRSERMSELLAEMDCITAGVATVAPPSTAHIRSVPGGAAFLRVAAAHWCPSTAHQCDQGCGDECQRLAPDGVSESGQQTKTAQTPVDRK